MAKKLTKDKVTCLKSFYIEDFRGLTDISIKFGDNLTLICGKNGTSKSTILGVAAQIFNFKKYYSKDGEFEIGEKTLNGKVFTSTFSEHFRFSPKHDKPGDMKISINVYDGAFRKDVNDLNLSLYNSGDRANARPVVRNNIPASSGSKNTSRNVTHPVIYLSLSRLIPVSQRSKYSKRSVEYLNENVEEFISICSQIMNRMDLDNHTATDGDLKSAVAHTDFYDQDSVSVGEDNVGQIALSLMSFKKLSEEFPNYHGGLLLIDEADAGLFPAAQQQLVKVLSDYARSCNLQVIMTSHSPVLINEVKNLSDKDSKKNKTLYLTSALGSVELKENWGWDEISADLEARTYRKKKSKKSKVNVYFEDNEAVKFFEALVRQQKYTSRIAMKKSIRLSSNAYKDYIREGVEEFSKNSLIVFDGDIGDPAVKKKKNCVFLPSSLPPDQLLFNFFLGMRKDDPYWDNELGFTKEVFSRIARPILSRYKLKEFDDLENIDLQARVNGQGQVRKDFKDNFFKNKEVQDLFSRISTNPFKEWGLRNQEEVSDFLSSLEGSLAWVSKNSLGIDLDF
tara:strand:+ start:3358 stop:5052 length:1695 start_codon:yes stop_codon:yes gene_type:complete